MNSTSHSTSRSFTYATQAHSTSHSTSRSLNFSFNFSRPLNSSLNFSSLLPQASIHRCYLQIHSFNHCFTHINTMRAAPEFPFQNPHLPHNHSQLVAMQEARELRHRSLPVVHREDENPHHVLESHALRIAAIMRKQAAISTNINLYMHAIFQPQQPMPYINVDAEQCSQPMVDINAHTMNVSIGDNFPTSCPLLTPAPQPISEPSLCYIFLCLRSCVLAKNHHLC